MNNRDVFSMALRNLFKRKLRSFLTIFGVVIGTCAIVIMISLTIGSNRGIEESLSRMGDLLTVEVYHYNYASFGGGVAISTSGGTGGRSNELKLDDNAIERFKQLPGVLVATPYVDVSVKAVSGKLQNWIQLRGIAPEAMELMGYALKSGTLFTGEHEYEAVFGYNPPFEFYNPRVRYREWSYWWPGSGEEDTRVAPVDIFLDKILFSYDYSFGESNVSQNQDQKPVKPYTLKTVGWLEYNGSTDYYVYMPLDDVLNIKEAQEKWQNTYQTQYGGSGNKRRAEQGYNNATVKFNDIKTVEAGLNSIREMGFDAYGMVESLKAMQDMLGSIQILLAAVGGVALFVSAIGIANTMIMAIYERTKEIGVMKVIGATLHDIRRLFLTEAALIGFLGGSLGVGVSYGASVVINKMGISAFDQFMYGLQDSRASVIPLWLALAGVGGAIIVGTVSGFFPALRATRLSALAAIRGE